MRQADFGPKFYSARGLRGWLGFLFNVFLILVGLFFLTAGTYSSVQSIIVGYQSAGFGGPFSCATNGV